jgi:O-antigen biosynthesis protein WbqP
MYKNVGKRALDFIIALVALVAASLPGALIALWIMWDSKGPVFFRQKRVGRDKSHFMILKFRTMRVDAPKDVPTHLLNDPYAYITRSGRFLRRTSLDELPQLFNILRGEMSFVGPRPALHNQLDLIEHRDAVNANAVRPGLTGWAQVNGRDELPIEVKAKFDGEYVQNLSLLLDIRCILRTLRDAFRGQGVVEGGPSGS